MKVQVFNSSVLAGPELLVLPNLRLVSDEFLFVFLREKRKATTGLAPWDFAQQHGFRTRIVEVSSRFDSKAIGQLREELLDCKATIVHAHDVKASFYSLKATSGRRREADSWKLISTHHGVRGRPDWKTLAYESYFTRMILPRFDAVCTVSSTDRNILAARGVPISKLFLHLNGIGPLPGEARGRAKVSDENSLRLAWVGRFSEEKRPQFAIEVLKALLQREKNVHLTMIGDGKLLDPVRSIAERTGVLANVEFTGYLEDAYQRFSEFDLLLNTSQYEGLPVSLLEAGWCSLPVCAKAEDGFLDVCIGDCSSLLFSPSERPAEVASRIMANRARLRALGEDLQRRVQECFSRAAWLERLSEIYDSV